MLVEPICSKFAVHCLSAEGQGVPVPRRVSFKVVSVEILFRPLGYHIDQSRQARMADAFIDNAATGRIGLNMSWPMDLNNSTHLKQNNARNCNKPFLALTLLHRGAIVQTDRANRMNLDPRKLLMRFVILLPLTPLPSSIPSDKLGV